jgi:flagellar protein FliL
MNKKILISVLVVLLVGGYFGYTVATAKPTKKMKIDGTIYVLPKDFTINLAGGQYASLTAALLLAPGQSVGTTDADNPPPTGFGSLPEEPVVRAIITNVITNQPASALITQSGRANLEHEILTQIKQQTDDAISQVYFTDVAVQ